MQSSLLAVTSVEDILPDYRQTPIGWLLEYHNLGRPFERYDSAQLLIGMCMDHRKQLRIPAKFAYILRTGGANLKRIEFKISFAIAVGGVKALALIGHDQCGMMNLSQRREAFIHGLVDRAGWSPQDAEAHFDQHVSEFEVADTTGFVASEAQRLRERYPKLLVAPLFYRVDEGKLWQVVQGVDS